METADMSASIRVKQREYYDSVRLMRTAEMVRRQEGVQEAMLVMATESNKQLLEAAGLPAGEAAQATPNDLVIAIVAKSEEAAERAMEEAERLLKERAAAGERHVYRTLTSALGAMRGGNLALISVPGEYAAAEARRALESGLHVMLFSDNVSLEDEVSLKRLAQEKGLMMMGPDCGTAIINGAGLGFANVVRRGTIGIAGASGTGIQALSALIDRQGAGVSHAIGAGSRDLSPEVSGATMLAAIALLAADPATEVLALTSKPPDPEVSRAILERAVDSGKPVVANFLGGDPEIVTDAGAFAAATLEEAARKAVSLAQGGGAMVAPPPPDGIERLAAQEAQKVSGRQRFIRGLYAGGTLCYEALLILENDHLLNGGADGIDGKILSNVPLRPEQRLADPWQSRGHTLLDLGEDAFTRGRPHPMIDSTLRAQRLVQEAEDPETAVVLLDVVLGHGAHEDPAGSLTEAIAEARAKVTEAGGYLPVVASVCGTAGDPQNAQRQEDVLREAGVVVMDSNAQAVRLAGRIAQLANA